MTKKVAVLIGSVSPNSLNRKLARAMELAAPDSLEFVEVPIEGLPFYYSGYDKNPTESGQEARDLVSAADAVLVVTPEYNRSMPAVLKNALDWLSRPFGGSALAGKPALIAGASPGGIATAVAQSQARSILPMIGAFVMGQPELYISISQDQFDEEGRATKEGTQEFLSSALEKFSAFVDKLS